MHETTIGKVIQHFVLVSAGQVNILNKIWNYLDQDFRVFQHILFWDPFLIDANELTLELAAGVERNSCQIYQVLQNRYSLKLLVWEGRVWHFCVEGYLSYCDLNDLFLLFAMVGGVERQKNLSLCDKRCTCDWEMLWIEKVVEVEDVAFIIYSAFFA